MKTSDVSDATKVTYTSKVSATTEVSASAMSTSGEGRRAREGNHGQGERGGPRQFSDSCHEAHGCSPSEQN
jgi:hypothetical protein